MNRRDLLRGGAGFGALALTYLLATTRLRRPSRCPRLNPLAPRPPHLPPGKSVIFLFMEGGPSHIDRSIPSRSSNELAGKPLPASFGKPSSRRWARTTRRCWRRKRKWKQHGESGLWVSDWLPHIAELRRRPAPSSARAGPTASTTRRRLPDEHRLDPRRPAVARGVGQLRPGHREPEPARVRRHAGQRRRRRQRPAQLGRRLHAGRLPGHALAARRRADPATCNTPEGVDRRRSSAASSTCSTELNRQHAADAARADRARRPHRQLRAGLPHAGRGAGGGRPGARRPRRRKRLYGLDEKETADVRPQCACWPAGWSSAACGSCSSTAAPAASGTPTPSIEKNHAELCRAIDKPVAGLLTDLKRRGLLDETLVDLGRRVRPHADDARRATAATTTRTASRCGWPAAACSGGQTIGATDEVGLHAVEDRLHVHDLHATILHLLGLDHMRLVYRHKGRPGTADAQRGRGVSADRGVTNPACRSAFVLHASAPVLARER